MADQLGFDERAARQLEHIYSTPDVVEQRAKTLEALDLQAGERVLDIGVGPGYLSREMAEQVGRDGRVVGIDSSDSMLSMAKRRCENLSWVSMREADAVDLPFEGATFDAAVSTQVYEYVADIDRALAELRRVLKPGGRALIVDTDWDSIVLNSEDPELTNRILGVWDDHLVDPYLPRRLRALLTKAGFTPGLTMAIPILNTEYDENTYSHGSLGLIEGFVVRRGGLDKEEVARWMDGIRSLGARGEYFFSVNRYLFVAHKRE